MCLLGRNLFLSNFNRETTDFFLIFRILRHGLRSSQLPTQLCQISRLNAVQTQRIYLRILRNLMLRYRQAELIQLFADELRNLNFLIVFQISTILLFGSLTLCLIADIAIAALIYGLRCSNSHFTGVVYHINGFNNLVIIQRLVAKVLKQRTHLQHADYALLLLLIKIIEEIRRHIQECTHGSHNNQHAHQLVQQVRVAVVYIQYIKGVFVAVALIHAVSLIHSRQNGRGQQRYDITNGQHGCKHTVNTLTGTILLIVTNICLNGRCGNLFKCTNQPVKVHADKQPPNAAHIDNHRKNTNNVCKVYGNQYLLLAPLANTNGSQ